MSVRNGNIWLKGVLVTKYLNIIIKGKERHRVISQDT